MLAYAYDLVSLMAARSPLGLIAAVFAILFTAYILYTIVAALLDPLRDIPGPFAARFTRLWLFREFKGNRFEHSNIALHKQYGPVVRISPNVYSLNDSEAVKVVYGHGTRFIKAPWYTVWQNPGLVNLFSHIDPVGHAAQRRKFSTPYSMSALVSYEPYIDECNVIFRRHLDDAAKSRSLINMQLYNQCYAFDVIGMLTFSYRLGFLDRCRDEIGLIGNVHRSTQIATLAGLFPSLWRKIMSVAPPSLASLTTLGDHVIPRVNKQFDATVRSGAPPAVDGTPVDFTQKLTEAHLQDRNKITRTDILLAAAQNMSAGSDTTSISLSAVMYYLSRNPNALQKLRDELDKAYEAGQISEPIRFHEAQKLPYLQATIKEAIRLHPATGLPFQRVVPADGVELCGYHFPAGSVLGLNPWVTHRNTDIWGPDAADFRPERWIEGNVPPDIQYLSGSRTCLGKNISMLEISKLIPGFVRHYDLKPAKGNEDWECENRWFVKPVDFFCYISKRVV